MSNSEGRVVLVGAGPGAPDLISVRGERALESADVVLHDRLVHSELVDGLEAEVIDVGKRKGDRSRTQAEIDELMIEHARRGREVVRLKGGDPTVFGRGSEEMVALREAGVEYELVPGITSATAAPAIAGVPVTHRGWADGFTVVTAHRSGDRADFSIPPYHPRRTLVLLMGVGTMATWRRELFLSGYPRDLPVCLVTRASLDDQRVVVTTLEDCLVAAEQVGIEPPATAIVGRTVAIREYLRRRRVSEEDLTLAPLDLDEFDEDDVLPPREERGGDHHSPSND
ncbi:MAG: uroporphyrinogen-III C-methyltransferase [Bradymonadaceae bacterium]